MTTNPWTVAVRDVLRLALGRPVPAVANWQTVFEVARAERLLGIAWLRSGAGIRTAAPTSVVTAWRDAALELDELARSQMDTIVTVTKELTKHGVNATVLKGPPLSMRIYGEPGARQSGDIDILVPSEARPVCQRALEASGWTKWLGEPPCDESFYRRRGGRGEYLEVHSLLPSEALSHCGPLTIDAHRMTTPGVMDVAAGRALPVYLAGNMAKHAVIRLSAIVDFDALWSSLLAAERAMAVAVARDARLHRCLQWAVQQTALIHAAADGHADALRKLGVRVGGREFTHLYLRLIGLADNPVDAARVAGAWIWPRTERTSWRALGTVWNRRLHKPLTAVGSFRQSYGGR